MRMKRHSLTAIASFTFSLDGISAFLAGRRNPALMGTPFKRPEVASPIRRKEPSTFQLFSSNGNNINDDDGWDTEDLSKSTISDTSNSLSQERELASLRSQIASKKEEPTPSLGNGGKTASVEADRDLFIPIFALVSLAGLFGAYGYEMMRLYSRGELYLPGQ